MEMFGRTESQLSRIVTHMLNDLYDKFHHLLEFDERRLTAPMLEELAQTVAARGAPLDRCFGFIDGTLRGVCRPSFGQRQLFSGHKRTHGLKFQSVVTPDGIIIHMSGPWAGRHHDAHMLRESGLAALLERHCSDDGGPYLIYGDPAYPVQAHIRSPHRDTQLTAEQVSFNASMSSVRQCVEWCFGDIIRNFAFLDFKKNPKVVHQPVGKLYIVGAFLTNVRTCMHGNLTASYFMVDPPALSEYLHLE